MSYGSHFAKRVLALAALALIAFTVSWLDPLRGTAAHTVDIWFFDIGQGDATLIQSGSTQILIDGGPSGVVIEKLGRVMPFWDQTIEYVFLTHPHADHVTGLVALSEYYDFGEVYTSAQEYDSQVYQVFLDTFDPRFLQSGDLISPSGAISLSVLWPDHVDSRRYDDPNAGSVVLLASIYDTDILLPADAGVDEEGRFISSVSDIDILKVGHHGSYTSTSRALLETSSPEHGIISAGEQNRFGHPHEVVLSRLAEFGVRVWRTDYSDIRARIKESSYILEGFLL